jgi:hypothetical protein
VDGHQSPGQRDGFRAVIGQNEGCGGGHGFLPLGFFFLRSGQSGDSADDDDHRIFSEFHGSLR